MVSETDTDRLKCNADRFTAWTSESNVGRDRMYVSLPSIFKSGESNRLTNACTDLLLRQIQLLPSLADIITKPIVLHSSVPQIINIIIIIVCLMSSRKHFSR